LLWAEFNIGSVGSRFILANLILSFGFVSDVYHVGDAQAFSWLEGVSWDVDVLSVRLKILFGAELVINSLAQETSELILSGDELLLSSLFKLKTCGYLKLVRTNWWMFKLGFPFVTTFRLNFLFCN